MPKGSSRDERSGNMSFSSHMALNILQVQREGSHSEVGVTRLTRHVVMVTKAGKMDPYQEDEVKLIIRTPADAT